ncbi:tetratricopeptide repeat protein [Actibacterium ureilyticum]|uniref:tetratricopeptide repeat protein n=1 Tax=Actibacterium ureilyticum TaxID=1590614 RepID=UPI000BAAF4A6|nr:tetratricopeptide repeat protein [Actibacterium ureilyticum]
MPLTAIRSLCLVAAIALGGAGTGAAQDQGGLAGAFLAARHASLFNDYAAAVQYYTRALARDPSNPLLLESALVAFAGLGQVDKAVPIARRMQSGGIDSQTAHMILLAEDVRRGAFDQVIEDLDAGRSIGPLVDGLIRAWSHFGAGRMSEALEAFDAASAETGLSVFGLYHKGLALAAVGDFESAEAVLASDEAQPLLGTRRGALARVTTLSQLERNDDAVALLDEAFGLDLDPGLADIRARLVAGETIPFDTIRNAQDGIAEVFFTVAGALNGDANDSYTLIYARMAEFLHPQHVDAMLLIAALLESQERYDLAVDAYLRVPSTDPAFYAAELGRAEALRRDDKPEAAIEVLTQLSKTHAEVPIVHITLGDMQRRDQNFAAATQAYDKAIALLRDPTAAQWAVFYARGISQERTGNWDKAEADFRKALELNPDQPQVLNYLGYSFVEKRQNLDEALDMIERAVAARPNDGYITDSLGWILFRLGRYDEAAPHMERAAELEPIDPIVNDHLGDVLWAVGRKREAEFQWKRALSFVDPDDVPADLDPDRIRRKLEIGLDAVLAEEGAEPLKVAKDG